MKTAFLFIALIACTMSAYGQKTYVWKGGKAGRANDWNCAANWSTNQVPDESADVIIPKTAASDSYPFIKSGFYTVNTMRISCGARLTISERAALTILNPDYCEDVSRIVVHGKLELPGKAMGELEQTVVVRLKD